jgi:hypothetical protein
MSCPAVHAVAAGAAARGGSGPGLHNAPARNAARTSSTVSLPWLPVGVRAGFEPNCLRSPHFGDA